MLLIKLISELVRIEEFVRLIIADGTYIADSSTLAGGNITTNPAGILTVSGFIRRISNIIQIGNLARTQIANGFYKANGMATAEGTHIIASPLYRLYMTRVTTMSLSILTVVLRRISFVKVLLSNVQILTLLSNTRGFIKVIISSIKILTIILGARGFTIFISSSINIVSSNTTTIGVILLKIINSSINIVTLVFYKTLIVKVFTWIIRQVVSLSNTRDAINKTIKKGK